MVPTVMRQPRMQGAEQPAAHHSWIVSDAGERHGYLDVSAFWLRERASC